MRFFLGMCLAGFDKMSMHSQNYQTPRSNPAAVRVQARLRARFLRHYSCRVCIHCHLCHRTGAVCSGELERQMASQGK